MKNELLGLPHATQSKRVYEKGLFSDLRDLQLVLKTYNKNMCDRIPTTPGVYIFIKGKLEGRSGQYKLKSTFCQLQ